MEDYQLLVDFYKDVYRKGPGGDAETEKALNLSMVDRNAPLKVADIGCGTGASTLVLSRLLNAQITAVDLFRGFLGVLNEKARNLGVSERVKIICAKMENLPFKESEYDVIWAEGAIYNMGFEKGVSEWSRYLKLGGLLVVSEITWLTASRPTELQEHWEREYPEIDTASSKMELLERYGYSPIGYFVLPEHCWLENYYRPMEQRFEQFLKRNKNSQEARGIVEAEKQEIDLYQKYHDYYSYGVYIATKVGEPGK